ncbi:MAG: YraN family protein [Ottowia sp.]|nr:YraN family protein [Ottowia sp.]
MRRSPRASSYAVGAVWEQRALVFLRKQNLAFVQRNYRCKGGEIDLIMRTTDGTFVFVEVRARAHTQFGGAAASIGSIKQQRLIFAAEHYLLHFSVCAPCRFDVVAFDGNLLSWYRNAFTA